MPLERALTGRVPTVVRVLDRDPALAAGLAATDAEAVRSRAVAEVMEVPAGRWQPPDTPGEGGLGLLVLDGLLERDVVLAGVGCAELIGAGDLIWPWEDEEGMPSIPAEMTWTALEPTTLAVLDARFAAVAGQWPPLLTRLVGRSARLTYSLAVHFAITCMIGLELRLLVLLWHLADRFGRVEAAGVVIPLPLTHDLLGRLVRARRPSVTAALGELARSGLVERRDDGAWVVHGDPPQDFERLRRGDGGPLDAREA